MLEELEELYKKNRNKTLETIEYLEKTRHQALMQLQKTQILFKYLNWKQQELINNRLGHYKSPDSIKNGFGNFSIMDLYKQDLYKPQLPNQNAQGMIAPLINGAMVLPSGKLQRTKVLRQTILQLGIIEARARELIEAVSKSASVFNYQYNLCIRKLFPLGFLSRIWRSIKRYCNRPYFTLHDMGHVSNVGLAAGFVLEMVYTPVLGSRRYYG